MAQRAYLSKVFLGVKMKAVAYEELRGRGVHVRETYVPLPKDDEVLIKVAAASVIRTDICRRKGNYETLGFECSGIIETTGRMVTEWMEGDEVCALLDCGGYAEYVAVPAKCVISAPTNLELAHAAALPCSACIIWQSFFVMNKISSGQKILIHGGAGGVGSLAIQIAKHYGCHVFVTAGTREKLQYCASLGADICINHEEEDFSVRVNSETKGTGVDYILDSHDEIFMDKNLSSLAFGGKLIIIGSQPSWRQATVNCWHLGKKEHQIMGVDLTSLIPTDKEKLLLQVEEEIWPLVEKGLIIPRIYASYRLSQAAEVHKLMEKNGHLGKILLIP